jgi:hypothetical protein
MHDMGETKKLKQGRPTNKQTQEVEEICRKAFDLGYGAFSKEAKEYTGLMGSTINNHYKRFEYKLNKARLKEKQEAIEFLTAVTDDPKELEKGAVTVFADMMRTNKMAMDKLRTMMENGELTANELSRIAEITGLDARKHMNSKGGR